MRFELATSRITVITMAEFWENLHSNLFTGLQIKVTSIFFTVAMEEIPQSPV